MENSFPELGLESKDCTETSWINSTLYMDGYRNGESAADVLINRTFRSKNFFKAKSDFVKEPISETGLEGIWKLFLEGEGAVMVVDPPGEKMSEIPESETPFPHRAGNLYSIQYRVEWQEEGGGLRATKKQEKWMRKLDKYMAPYVYNFPGLHTSTTEILTWVETKMALIQATQKLEFGVEGTLRITTTDWRL